MSERLLILNGRTSAGYRIDDLSQEQTGMSFLANPFAIVPKKEDADLIVRAVTSHDDLVACCKAALLMEAQLRANDHKPGWKKDRPAALLSRLLDEARELISAVQRGKRHRTAIAKEAADVGNFAMMVADVCGALKGPAS